MIDFRDCQKNHGLFIVYPRTKGMDDEKRGKKEKNFGGCSCFNQSDRAPKEGHGVWRITFSFLHLYLYIIFIFSFAGVLRLAANEHELILSQPMRSIALRGGNRPKRYGIQSKKFENPPCLREATWPHTWHV